MPTPTIERTGRQEFMLDAAPESVGEARERLRAVAEHVVEASRLRDLMLVISEVVSNAVRHGAHEGETVLLAATPREGYLCVQVTDSGAGLAPRPRATAPDEDGGFGFFLIEQLTKRWGITRENSRTRVWFEFDFRPSTPNWT